MIASQQATLDLATLTGSATATRWSSPSRPPAAQAARPGSTCTSPSPSCCTSAPGAASTRSARSRGSAPPPSTKIREWVGHSQVTIRPVLDLDRADAVDGHDPPEWMRELVILRDGHCVFPWCTVDARPADLDHIDPYVPIDEGGPPGQTNPAQPRPPVPTTSPLQDQRPLALPTPTRRHLRVARTPRPQLPRHPTRHPRAPHQLTTSPGTRQPTRAAGPPARPGAGGESTTPKTCARGVQPFTMPLSAPMRASSARSC